MKTTLVGGKGKDTKERKRTEREREKDRERETERVKYRKDYREKPSRAITFLIDVQYALENKP